MKTSNSWILLFRSEACDAELHGTTITLSGLHQSLAYPDANKLRQVLLQDYGRQNDFRLTVDGKQLAVDDVSGSYSDSVHELPEVGSVKLRFAISDGKSGLRQPGITLRVDGKSVGKPRFFGLEELEDFPQSCCENCTVRWMRMAYVTTSRQVGTRQWKTANC